MTANQIAYGNLLENRRHNTVSEQEVQRHNVAGESIDRDKLAETKRHNIASLSETTRHNRVTESNQRYDTDVRSATADKDRTSREKVATLDRNSRERIASADRASKESIAGADRQTKESIADKDRRIDFLKSVKNEWANALLALPAGVGLFGPDEVPVSKNGSFGTFQQLPNGTVTDKSFYSGLQSMR